VNLRLILYFCEPGILQPRYFVIYKPYNMLSQFVSPYAHRLLGDLDFDFPEGTHAVGRLDEHSEGLLILTTDKTLTRRLLHPEKKHLRHYLVQVQHLVEPLTLQVLSHGLEIEVKKKGTYQTQPCVVQLIEPPLHLPEPEQPLHNFIKYSWLEFILTEGKNRQIRKMCKTVNHRCKRLIRTRINNLELGSMQPGEVIEMKREELFEKLLL
jgi:23S rRNA pseudouridine2457 synthase